MQQPDNQGGEPGGEKTGDRNEVKDRPQDQPPPRRRPPGGFRIQLDPNAKLPPPDKTGPSVCTDTDGKSDVFIGSAILHDVSLHPCKICPSATPMCRVPYGGQEVEHLGEYNILPITPEMEWVQTRNGDIPSGRRPVQGGYESNGEKLFHALGKINGIDVPGKTGRHLVSGSLTPFPRDMWD